VKTKKGKQGEGGKKEKNFFSEANRRKINREWNGALRSCSLERGIISNTRISKKEIPGRREKDGKRGNLSESSNFFGVSRAPSRETLFFHDPLEREKVGHRERHYCKRGMLARMSHRKSSRR